MDISSREKSTDLRIIFVGIFIAAAIFYLDLLIPLGVAESTLYVALVLIAYGRAVKTLSSGAPFLEPLLY